MKKVLLIILVVGLSLLLVGGGVFVAGLAAAGWDIKAFSGVKIEEKTFSERAENPLQSVKIDFKNADVALSFSAESEVVTIGYPQSQNRKGENLNEVTVSETDGCVTIAEKIDWRSNFALWNFSEPKVTVTLPAARTYAVVLETNNGDITVSGAGRLSAFTADTDNGDVETESATLSCEGDISLETDNGNVVLGGFDAQNLTAATNNGDIRLAGGAARGKVELETDNGDVEIRGALSANELSAETDNGDIEAEGILTAERISLSSAVGDIEAKIAGKREEYTITVEHDLGDANIVSQSGGAKTLFVGTDVGDIEISFAGA